MTTLHQKAGRSRLQSLAASSVQGQPVRAGGKFGAGLLTGVSAITRGEALGHGFWIDQEFLQSVASALAVADGSKCRFTHPGLCADGLAKGLGLAFGGQVQGDQVLTDLHFYASAHKSPDGDLAGYVMDRAAEDSKHFGTSIVFISDQQAEIDFMLANGGRWETVDDGWETYETIVDFKSPDPDNVDNLPHCRLLEFIAVDVVDDPAANPGGLFHRDLSTIKAAEGYLDHAFGLSEQEPTVALGVDIDIDRARQFFQTYAANRGLSVSVKEFEAMFKIFKKGKLATGGSEPPKNEPPKNDPPPAAEPPKPEGADQTPEGAVTCPDCGAVLTPEKKADEPPAEDPAAYAANHQKYVEAFGADNGSKWFFSKVKFEEAQTLHFKAQLAAKDGEIASLKAELKTAKETLASVAKDGAKPFGSSPPPNGTEGGAKGSGGFSAVFKVKGS